MIGILLAGGAATRLPNKPLLPQRNLKPVCFSGVDYLLRHSVDYIAVVIPPSSVLVDVLSDGYPEADFAFIYQEEPSGTGDAINLVERENAAIVVMADNIYPENEKIPIDPQASYVIIRQVPAWRAAHLVRVDAGPNRLTRSGPGRYALSTPWLLGRDFRHCTFPKEAWAQLGGLSRVVRPGEGWWDVGTPDTYAAYWRS